ncbi:MAG TPA: kelch repeat-containing protein [Thermoplasmata archaeon]|nr:kelch repeat-containing protein [Thermoplasmata archaeon]
MQSPAARFGAAIALFMNGTVEGALLFGGANSTGDVFGDTWQYNEVAGTWWNVTTALNCAHAGNCPSARHDASMVYDSEDSYTLLFGGCTVSPPGWIQSVPGCDSTASHMKQDTWYYTDPAALVGTWTNVNPATKPAVRYAAGLADDKGDGYVLLFGGCGTTCPYQQTWKYLAGVWTQLTPSPQPAGRYGMAMAYAQIVVSPALPVPTAQVSSGTAVVLLFGGCSSGSGGCPNGALNDTWYWTAGAWAQLLSATSCSAGPGICPSPRYYPGGTSYFYNTVTTDYGLLIYGGAGPDGTILGNATDVHGGDWWIYPTLAGANGWQQLMAPPGYVAFINGFFRPSPAAPIPPRYDTSLVGISGGEVMFGGSADTGLSIGDTWLASHSPNRAFAGELWPPPLPSARYGATMTRDFNDKTDVLFGGCGSSCGNASTWDFAAYRPTYMWVSNTPLLTAANSPSSRMNASMTNITPSGGTDSVVLFGGLSTSGTLLNDLWSYAAGVWTPQTPTGAGPPSARQGATFAYDETDGYAVLFGGCGAATCPLHDTWELTGSPAAGYIWAAGPTSGPPGRYGAAMTWDERDSYILLYGGCGTTCPLKDTWTFVGGVWTQCLTASCTTAPPAARWGSTMSFDEVDNEAVLFGGCGSTCPYADTWGYAAGNWYKITPTTSPPGRYDAVSTYDLDGQYVLMFGGVGPAIKLMGEFGWGFYAGNWYPAPILNQIPKSPAPAPRYGASLAANSAGNTVLLVGGCQNTIIGPCGPLSGQSDTWLFTNGGWREFCAGCGPGPRWDAGLSFDPVDGYFVLFGGCKAVVVVCVPPLTLADTWTFNGATWTQLAIAGPSARSDVGMTWDVVDSRVILFGGFGCTGAAAPACGDTWSFITGAWTFVTTPTAPTARFGPAMTFDLTDAYVVLYGGQGAGGVVFGDTWRFTLSTGWVQVSASGPLAPRYDAAIAFDLTDGIVILFGGATVGGIPLGDTWRYHVGIWTGAPTTWAPPAEWGMGMAFDQNAGPNGYVTLFGGSAATGYYAPGAPAPGAIGTGNGGSWLYFNTPNPNGKPYWNDSSMYV